MIKLYLIVLNWNGHRTIQVWYDFPPRHSHIKGYMPGAGKVEWCGELPPEWHYRPLDEIMAWYAEAKAAGTLPAQQAPEPAKDERTRGTLLELEPRETAVAFAERMKRERIEAEHKAQTDQ